MKKFFLKDDVRGVGQSLAGAILFAWLYEPATEISKNSSKGVISSFVDYFYSSCAEATGIEFISTLLMCAFLWFALFMILYFVLKFSAQIKSKKSEKVEQSTETNLSPNNLEKYNKKEIIIIKRYELEKKRERLKCLQKILSIINITLWVVFLCYTFVYRYYPVVKKEMFNRKIIQITPYVETHEIDLLKSEWVSMEGKDDYEQIEQKINDILSKNNLNDF